MRRPWLFFFSILTALGALGAAGLGATFHLGAGLCDFYADGSPSPADLLEACARDRRYAWALFAAALVLAVTAVRLQLLSRRARATAPPGET